MIYKDAIDVNLIWKVRFRNTFFQNEVQMVVYPLDHSRKDLKPFKLQLYSKTKEIKYVPIPNNTLNVTKD